MILRSKLTVTDRLPTTIRAVAKH